MLYLCWCSITFGLITAAIKGESLNDSSSIDFKSDALEASPVTLDSLQLDPVNQGMPVLDVESKPYSYFEFWPAWFFYIPVVVYWIYLSIKYRNFGLPMVVNPNIELGGMVGESKIDIMDSIKLRDGDHWLAYVYAKKESVATESSLQAFVNTQIARAHEAGIELPFVVKPDLGCRGAGVSLIKTEAQLAQYLDHFPEGRRFIIQQLAPHVAEAGVFYEREPGEKKGRITSVTLKYMPYVTGDGVRTLKELTLSNRRANKLKSLYLKKNQDRLSHIPDKGEHVVLAFAGSHCRGSIFKNGNAYITPEMTHAIDKIASSMPEFHYGRFDIKFDNIRALQKGEAFSLIEVNGASSEATHIWDSNGTLLEVFKTLFRQYRTLFQMGYYLRRHSGHRVPSARTMIKVWLRELKSNKSYPDSATEL